MCLSAVTKVSDGVITLLCMLLVVKFLIYEGGTLKLNDEIRVDEMIITELIKCFAYFYIVVITVIIIYHLSVHQN